MNKKISIFLGVTMMFSFFSCTDLSEEVYSDIPFDKFFRTEKDVLMNAGRAYTKLQSFPEEFSLWTLIEMASDEMVAPGRDDGFVWDNGRWDQLHTHAFESNNKILTLAWEFVYEGISACNEVLYETESSPIDFEGKDKIVAEIKVLRALYYYWAMDNWGNVPFSVDFTNKELPQQKNRAFLFDFIENEIKDNVDKLQEQPELAYYGRVTKGMAYTLLAKLYLNANEWIGTPKWEEAIAACDQVINLNAYEIEDDYFTNFKVQNENSKENIFVIVMNSIYTKDNFYWYTLTLNDASRETFDFNGQMWDEFVVEPGWLDKYAGEDLRRKSFLYGQQYDKNGNPIYFIEGTNKDTAWFVYTPEIANYMSRKRWEGARIAKYEYQPKLEYYVNDMENDFVIFRYADVLYTKLEALYRLGRAGEMISDPDLMKIRSRAGLAPYSVSDLNDSELLNELGREFSFEAHRRQDQIRFGVWGNPWWNKPASGPNEKLFPIPQTVLNVNPNLVQNPQ
ncbi:MAG: RagB/SusD family nutrient uptake outer membrane protein [Bacteroidales bacterium]|nr:RagB/SusD family nutrient uptake outer membrane protein [Bacteroidales bacterium]MCB8999958.1 RagB/SusD family nutrient uptake outer membrane protein [Bacteroidales bacterium]MCB9012591.1 RagB/SusD family nutrient uptake outer membrane protein [Bacteroidales bacterium]